MAYTLPAASVFSLSNKSTMLQLLLDTLCVATAHVVIVP